MFGFSRTVHPTNSISMRGKNRTFAIRFENIKSDVYFDKISKNYIIEIGDIYF